jgi:ribonuclease HI
LVRVYCLIQWLNVTITVSRIKRNTLLKYKDFIVYILVSMIDVYTDGSCLGNPGPGGWAYIIDDFIGRGGANVTTNNVMEMTAVVKALEKCIELGHDTVTVYTDSNYVKMGLLEWSKNWERNGWKTSKGEPRKE